MVERFFEQFPTIQAAVMDPRLRKLSSKDKVVEKMDGEDFKKGEEFVQLMRVLYTSRFCPFLRNWRATSQSRRRTLHSQKT